MVFLKAKITHTAKTVYWIKTPGSSVHSFAIQLLVLDLCILCLHLIHDDSTLNQYGGLPAFLWYDWKSLLHFNSIFLTFLLLGFISNYHHGFLCLWNFAIGYFGLCNVLWLMVFRNVFVVCHLTPVIHTFSSYHHLCCNQLCFLWSKFMHFGCGGLASKCFSVLRIMRSFVV